MYVVGFWAFFFLCFLTLYSLPPAHRLMIAFAAALAWPIVMVMVSVTRFTDDVEDFRDGTGRWG